MKNGNPVVSVIIPTYNRGSFITKAVESIEKQDYQNIEIIIVDDGSDDNTSDVVNRLMRQYFNILFFPNERVKGPSGARNTGISRSSGDYISFLDSDDVWLEGHLSKGINILQNNPEIDVLFGNFNVVDYWTDNLLYRFFDNKEIIFSIKTDKIEGNARIINDNLFEALIQENFFQVGSSIIKKETLSGVFFDENVTFSEDRDLAIRLYKEKNAKFAYREDPVFVLYRHDSNMTEYNSVNNLKKIIDCQVLLFLKYLKKFPLTYHERRLTYNLIAKKLLHLGYIHRLKKEYCSALVSIIKSCVYGLSLNQFIEAAKIAYCAASDIENKLGFLRK